MSETLKVTPLGVRIHPELRGKLKALAMQNRRSMNSEIVVLLEAAISKSDEKKKGSAQAS